MRDPLWYHAEDSRQHRLKNVTQQSLSARNTAVDLYRLQKERWDLERQIVLGSNDPNMLLTPLSKVFQQVSPGSQGHDAINHGARADVNRRYQT